MTLKAVLIGNIEKFGLTIADKDYFRPDTVKEVFADLENWGSSEDGIVDVFACDSIAALSTEMEMENEDKMGGKESEGVFCWSSQNC